jgi:hypothetical protein
VRALPEPAELTVVVRVDGKTQDGSVVGMGPRSAADGKIRPAFRGVLLDWRGTFAVAPTDEWLVRTALERCARNAASSIDAVLAGLRRADRDRVDSSLIDTDAAQTDAAALDGLGLPVADVLMVGDRGAWDGAAAELGITTLLVPPLRAPDELRLHRVLHLALPGH